MVNKTLKVKSVAISNKKNSYIIVDILDQQNFQKFQFVLNK